VLTATTSVSTALLKLMIVTSAASVLLVAAAVSLFRLVQL
jgi:hypothetical protein